MVTPGSGTLVRFRFALAFAAFICAAAAVAQPGVPFSLEVVQLETSQAPALHSAAAAQDAGRWLLVTGRTNGLHGLTALPDPFPAQFAHGAVVVYELATDTRWTAPLDGLPADIAAPLRATNTEFWQEGSTLYVIGGYGRDTAGANVTHPTLTAINVPGIIAAVQNGTPLAPHIRQLVDQRLAVAGGHLVRRGDRYQLIGGNRFDGDYLGGNMVQTYTEAVRSIWLSDDGTNLAITAYEEDVDATNLHRRDLNVGHVILPGGQESVSLYGGVFNNFNLPFRTPVQIDAGSHSTGSFLARFGHYTCPTLPMHDARNDAMHTVFLGGMGQFWFDETAGTVQEDFLVPFIDDVVSLTRAADGNVTETVLAARMPGYYGTNAQFFIDTAAPAWPNGVLRLESLPGRTLVGYIHGGILTDEPNPGWTGGLSEASSEVFAVYVTPQPLASEEGPGEAVLSLSAPAPNPAATASRLQLTTTEPVTVRVEIFDATGRRAAILHDGQLGVGSHALEVDVASFAPGLYIIRASGDGVSASRRLMVGDR